MIYYSSGRSGLKISRLSEFRIQRCIKPKEFGRPTLVPLHHFSDPSEGGYGAVSYARLENNQHNVHVAFLLGKATVATVLAVQVDKRLILLDSTSVLKYIKNKHKRFHTSMTNRVTSIYQSVIMEVCEHKDNPTDDASRGRKAGELLAGSRWLEGPSFLWRPERCWPESIVESSIPVNDPEVKRDVPVNTLVGE